MLSVNLNAEEMKTLKKILEEYYTELRGEISNTENWEFKEGLKKEEQVLIRVLENLSKGVKN